MTRPCHLLAALLLAAACSDAPNVTAPAPLSKVAPAPDRPEAVVVLETAGEWLRQRSGWPREMVLPTSSLTAAAATVVADYADRLVTVELRPFGSSWRVTSASERSTLTPDAAFHITTVPLGHTSHGPFGVGSYTLPYPGYGVLYLDGRPNYGNYTMSYGQFYNGQKLSFSSPVGGASDRYEIWQWGFSQWLYADYTNPNFSCRFSRTSYSAYQDFVTPLSGCPGVPNEVYVYNASQMIDQSCGHTATSSGTSYIGAPGQYTYTATVTGNPSGWCSSSAPYDYQWWHHIQGNDMVVPICTNAPTCVVTVNEGDPSFTMSVHTSRTFSGVLTRWAFAPIIGVTVNILPPPTGYITGPEVVSPGQTCNWTVYASGGQGGYTYQWSFINTSNPTQQQVSGSVSYTGSIEVHITDAAGRVGHASIFVQVEEGLGCSAD